MKSLIFSLSTLLFLLVSAEFSLAQTTATASKDGAKVAADKQNCDPAACAKICAEKPDCKPEDCAKVCADKAACQPANCAKTASTTTGGVEAAFAILVDAKKEENKTSCCAKTASTSTKSCNSGTKESKVASNN